MDTKRCLEAGKLILFYAFWASYLYAIIFVVCLAGTDAGPNTLRITVAKTILVLGWIGRIIFALLVLAPLVGIVFQKYESRQPPNE